MSRHAAYDHEQRPYPIRRAFTAWSFIAAAQIGAGLWVAVSDPTAGAVVTALAAVGLVVGLLSIRRAEHDVTPTVDPRDDQGVPYVPIANDVYED